MANSALTAQLAREVAKAVTPMVVEQVTKRYQASSKKKKAKRSVQKAKAAEGPARALVKNNERKPFTYNGTLVVSVTNSATSGLTSSFFGLALDSQDNVWNLATYSDRLTKLRDMYRHWRLRRLRVQYVPLMSDTAGGSVAIGIDADPSVAAETNVGTVYQREIATLAHIRSETSLEWKPISQKDREERYTVVKNRTNSTRANEELSYGTVLITSSNNQGANVTIGYLKVDFSIDFDEEC